VRVETDGWGQYPIIPSPGLRPPSPLLKGRGVRLCLGVQGRGLPLIPTEFHCEMVSEALRQARYGSPLVSPESPDVVAGTALVGFSVARI